MNIIDSHNIRRMAVALGATAILAGCSSNGEEPAPQQVPMLIEANAAASRAAVLLSEKYNDFGVWAWKVNADNSQSLVLGRAAEATPTTEYYTRLDASLGWTYEYSDAYVTQYLRYWDRAALNYYFSAYSPYFIGEEAACINHTITATSDGVCISGIVGNIDADEGTDWLEAHWERQIQIDFDLITGASHIHRELGDVVPLAFHHLLALTEFRIFSDTGSDMELSDLTISFEAADAIHTQGDYAAPTGWTYTPDADETGIYSLPDEAAIDLSSHISRDTALSLTTLLQLPQTVTGRTVNIQATAADGAVFTGSFQMPEGWQRETKYIYFLCISSNEIILMDFSAVDWQQGEAILVADPVINW